MTRRHCPVLVPAPLFISEGVGHRTGQSTPVIQRVLFYPHPTPRGALELGRPHAIVVPWSEHSRSIVRGQCELPSSVVLVGDIRIHIAERQRGKHRGQRETPVASQVINRLTLPCGRSQRTSNGTGPSLYPGRPSAVRGQHPLAPSVALVCDIRIQIAERQSERHRGQSETQVASQVINHRTISRAQVGPRAPAAKNSTVTENWSIADSLKQEKLEQQVS